ncbi:MAG: ABC transporter ATP-binding protein [Cyclobacteriaceae bacterium]
MTLLTNRHIVLALREAAEALNHSFNMEALEHVTVNQRHYLETELDEFRRDLMEAGNQVRILLMEHKLPASEFEKYSATLNDPVLVFQIKKDQPSLWLFRPDQDQQVLINTAGGMPTEQTYVLDAQEEPEILFFSILHYESPVSIADGGTEPVTPVRRLWQLLLTEKREILYILFYALVVGAINLTVPLGIQTTVELISGGVVFSSVYLMIGLVIVSVVMSGILQIVQISLVEYLQRRVFTKSAFEFAFRIPRLRMESIQKSYAPELVNRFFDVITLQKGLPKLLIDLSSAVIQILFGLLLISLYHPFFVFFSLGLVLILVLILSLTGPRGLSSSIQESKYKYKVAQWLEELARAMHSFKLAGHTTLPLHKTDLNVSNYLKNRKIHFSTLVTQLSFIVAFKALIIGGLLIMGTYLVVNRQITLGQLVASEVVIILILNAIEKIIMYMDVVYDLLTAVDKVAMVTDLPIDRTGGLDLPRQRVGYAVRIRGLRYRYEDKAEETLRGVDLDIAPGEKVCISGGTDAGKSTLTNILSGLYTNYSGVVSINRHSLRDIDLTHLRDHVAKNISAEDLFDGTIMENISVGKPDISTERVIESLEEAGILDIVNGLPQGLQTHILSGGKGWSETFVQRLILARCLAERPQLLIVHDLHASATPAEHQDYMRRALRTDPQRTVIIVSNHPSVLKACDRVVRLDQGRVTATGTYQQLLEKGIQLD